ncbi:MAG TPA: enoyl-CoA hydratase-related protein [Roseiflexaceae bacterium]|nr:enoyl-CoA hydratase-related protein [Roseiflexaceae bacterium]
MPYENLLFEQADGVATISINRPQVRNALNRATIAEIGAALQAVEDADDLRVAIITGSGDRAFAAGADIAELNALPDAEAARRMSEESHQLGLRIADLRTIVIAAINGYALGGGLELALACDLRLAADTARLGQPEINLGIMPGWGGTQRLPRLVGPGTARLLCLTGEPIDAAEALRIGLIERICPAATLLADTQALARTIAARAPLAVAAIKQAIGRGLDMPLAAGCMYEAALFGSICATADAHEGMAAFLAKRPPTWSGR